MLEEINDAKAEDGKAYKAPPPRAELDDTAPIKRKVRTTNYKDHREYLNGVKLLEMNCRPNAIDRDPYPFVYPSVTDDKTIIWDEHDHWKVISDKIRKECQAAFDHVDVNDIETIINE